MRILRPVLATILVVTCGLAQAQRRAASPSHPKTAVSKHIVEDRGGLDVRVHSNRVVLRSYERTANTWRLRKTTVKVAGTQRNTDPSPARDAFRQVRARILGEEHFAVSHDKLLAAAMEGAAMAAKGKATHAQIYTAATDALVAELQKVDRWSRVETVAENVKRTTPAANNVTSHRLPGDVVLVKIARFRGPVAEQARKALADAVKRGPVKGIVIDLRGNGGGSVAEARALVSTFMPTGKPLVTTEYGPLERPTKVEVMLAEKVPGGPDLKTPIALLVNKKSASASELTTGILKDAGRATVFGETTYGKGVGQASKKLADGRVFQLTGWRRRLAGLGTYHGKGLAPDVNGTGAKANVRSAAKAGKIRDRGDTELRSALLHLWSQQAKP